MKTNKRSLFNVCVALLSLLTIVACSSNDTQNPSVKRVVVVGAGIAGLTAADMLDEQGFEVIVLESRDRIGGRLWTDRGIEGVPLDLGASWIHGIDANPVYELAQKHGVPLYEWDTEDAALYDTHGESSATLSSRIDALNDEFMALVSESRFRHVTIDDVIETALREGELSAYSEAEINFLLSGIIEDEYAAPSRLLSVSALMEGEVVKGAEVIFPQGYDQLTSILAQGLNVRTQHKVTDINYESDKPIVTAKGQNFEADYVLVTVPLGVLKNGTISFTPGLPRQKTRAINALGMGTLNKVYLKFPVAFWEDEARNIAYISDPKGQFTFWINLAEATSQAILLGFMSGDEAIAMEGQSDEDIVARAMTVLKNIYGDAIPTPEQQLITRWASDPHSYGSYSYLSAGATSEMREDLAAPIEEKVFFAGEATHEDYPSTIHGALLSGQRAANWIIRSRR